MEGSDHIELIVAGLLLAVATLVTLARVLSVPYPVFLVLGGLGLGALPLPDISLDPDLVLFIFLPPLLYSAAFFASLRDLRKKVRPIGTLAVGLVLATCVAVAAVAHALIPGISWPAAFVLGAIVSPTDPVAATAIASRIGVPRRVVTVVEGEALINDATALAAYSLALKAVDSGAFSAPDAALTFFGGAAGGIAIGLAVGWVVAQVRRRLDDPPVEITISMLTGYLAYLPAEELGVSGVIAAVTVGLYMGSQTSRVTNATVRMQSQPFWQILVFLLNSVLFVLIGLELPVLLDGLQAAQVDVGDALWWGAAISLVVIATRLVWTFVFTYVPRALSQRFRRDSRPMSARATALIGWMGMRGAVSLAAALALPLETKAGDPFPERAVILMIVFIVILVTLVVQGLTLAPAVKLLRLPPEDGDVEEENRARLTAVEAALERLDAVADAEWSFDDSVERTRRGLTYRRNRFAARFDDGDDGGYEDRSSQWVRIQVELIQAQRDALRQLERDGTISSEVMRRVQRDLDLEEARLLS